MSCLRMESNKAAEVLKIGRTTLWRKLKILISIQMLSMQIDAFQIEIILCRSVSFWCSALMVLKYCDVLINANVVISQGDGKCVYTPEK